MSCLHIFSILREKIRLHLCPSLSDLLLSLKSNHLLLRPFPFTVGRRLLFPEERLESYELRPDERRSTDGRSLLTGRERSIPEERVLLGRVYSILRGRLIEGRV